MIRSYPMHAMAAMTATLALALLLFGASPALAQGPEPEFMQQLYPPELIMRHGREIGLRPEQRKAITSAVAKTQATTLELQWDMQDAAQALSRLMSAERIDRTAAIDAAASVMELEGRVKRAHLGLLIDIKNQLDAEQQDRLRELRAASPRP
jgi:Spy/CpxP family protein refolding chaperone